MRPCSARRRDRPLGYVRPRLLLVLDDPFAEVDLLDHATGDPVSTLMGLAARPDIEHRILISCVEEGKWLAWAFGALNDDQRSFWLATTAFEVHPGGLGVGTGSWELVFGVGLDGVPFPASSLGRSEPPMVLLPAQVPQTLQIACIAHDIPANEQAPTDPGAATNVRSQMGFEDRAYKEGLDGTLVVIFRERTFEQWHVTGEIPFGLDLLVRNMCATATRPSRPSRCSWTCSPTRDSTTARSRWSPRRRAPLRARPGHAVVGGRGREAFPRAVFR